MSDKIESLILKGMIHDEDYCRKVFPFLKEEYFDSPSDKIVFSCIYDFIAKHNALPTIEAISICSADKQVSSELYQNIQDTIKELKEYDKPNQEWFLGQTEKFCKDKAIINAFRSGIEIIDGRDKKRSVGVLPDMMKEALAVSFNTSVGHSYAEDYEDRFSYYHTKEEQLPFDINILNKITNGGVPKKTLNIVVAGTGIGKSTFLSHLACSYFMQGYNVFYATFEMSKEKTSERFDANLLNIPIQDLKNIPKPAFLKSLNSIISKTTGKLIVEEYPTSTASVFHVANTLNELSLKKNFKPDVIILDYLNIMVSARLKSSNSVSNMYTYVKYIAEEVRGLSVIHKVPVWTATQLNRSGYNASDVGLENTSESFGVPATADLMLALISTDELEKQNQIMIKQLKNRYNEAAKDRKILLGIDRPKMRFYELEESAQSDIIQNVRDFDNSNLPVKDAPSKFSGFKF